jgi:hypothetical protein
LGVCTRRACAQKKGVVRAIQEPRSPKKGKGWAAGQTKPKRKAAQRVGDVGSKSRPCASRCNRGARRLRLLARTSRVLGSVPQYPM